MCRYFEFIISKFKKINTIITYNTDKFKKKNRH